MGDSAILILRLGLGTIFTGHGLQKAFGMFNGPGIAGFTQMLTGMGFAPAAFWAYLAAYVELISGIFLILGIFTRTASTLLFILIVVAALKVHLSKGFFLSSGGFEYTLLIACVCAALAILGGGKFSLVKKF
jgi:putative oxidoreductase